MPYTTQVPEFKRDSCRSPPSHQACKPKASSVPPFCRIPRNPSAGRIVKKKGKSPQAKGTRKACNSKPTPSHIKPKHRRKNSCFLPLMIRNHSSLVVPALMADPDASGCQSVMGVPQGRRRPRSHSSSGVSTAGDCAESSAVSPDEGPSISGTPAPSGRSRSPSPKSISPSASAASTDGIPSGSGASPPPCDSPPCPSTLSIPPDTVRTP